jgi:hypothetical protein
MKFLRPRLSLRLLLIGVAFLCVGLAIWTHRAREQARIIRRIELNGGLVLYKFQLGPFFRKAPINDVNPSPVPDWLLKYLGQDFFHSVQSVWYVNRPGDFRQWVKDLPRLKGLEEISLYTNDLCEEDVSGLSVVLNLKRVSFTGGSNNSGLPIGDRTLEWIGHLPKIQSVSISGQGISPKGLRALLEAKTLREVSIRGCNAFVRDEDANLFSHNNNITDCQIWKTTLDVDVESVYHRFKPIATTP